MYRVPYKARANRCDFKFSKFGPHRVCSNISTVMLQVPDLKSRLFALACLSLLISTNLISIKIEFGSEAI